MIEFQKSPGSLPSGQRVYAVGDVHGCLNALVAMHELIEADLVDRPIETATLVHVGDYIDRGPKSAQVIQRLMRKNGPSIPTINLMGNHEDMLLDSYDTGRHWMWLQNGGHATLDSYNAETTYDIPDSHIKFIRELKLTYQLGSYFFVHAGVEPSFSLDKQGKQDFLWVRDSFLYSTKDFGFIVVHGHTPMNEPSIRVNAIGIDTGTVFGGPLTCAVLEGDQVGFLQIFPGQKRDKI